MPQAEPAVLAARVKVVLSGPLFPVVTEELAATPPQPQPPAQPMAQVPVLLPRLLQAVQAEQAASPHRGLAVAVSVAKAAMRPRMPL